MKKKHPGICYVFFIMMFLLLLPFVKTVEIQGNSGDERFIAAGSGARMTLRYTHSMYKVPQEERYRIEGGRLLHTGMFFGDIQASRYYDSYNQYTFKWHPDGSSEIEDINVYYDELNFALGHGTGYTITVGEKRPLYLNVEFKNSSLLKINIRDLSLLEYGLKGVL